MLQTVRIWDVPTRLFHWTLVACVIGLVVTANIGGAAMTWHFRLGYGVLSLLLFRLVWGFVGGYWSRFVHFVRGPLTIWRYLNGRAGPTAGVGHNPMGALSVLAMLVFLLLQVSTGLMSDDEISAAGPLTRYAPGDWIVLATFYHRNVGKYILLALIFIHLFAIGFYFFRRHENLVKPMVTGDKGLSVIVPASKDGVRQRLLALLVVGLCGGAVAATVAWLEA